VGIFGDFLILFFCKNSEFLTECFSENIFRKMKKIRKPWGLYHTIFHTQTRPSLVSYITQGKKQVQGNVFIPADWPAFQRTGTWGDYYTRISAYTCWDRYTRNSRAASLLCRVFRISAVQVACLPRCCSCRWVGAFDKQNRGASEGEV
jgi:hypothetical protein